MLPLLWLLACNMFDQAPASSTEPDTVVLVVIDTLRADHTSLCGYERPTTPGLKALAQRSTATYTCNAYTPGTWTLPSHASFFTGMEPTEHELLHLGHPLTSDRETLAEIFRAKGYSTVLVSGNPVLTGSSGVDQGFQQVVHAKSSNGGFRGEVLNRRVAEILAELPKDGPLFLVVNVFDAHDPYPEVPEGISWLSPHPPVELTKHEDATSPWRRFVAGHMAEEEQRLWLENLVDGYDYGVRLADRSVRRLFNTLKQGGWMDRPHRIVITSDHGEHLGDKGRVRHDGPPLEAVTRVPLIMLASDGSAPEFPDRVSATGVFDLLLHGTLPERSVTSVSVAYREKGNRRRPDAVAVWSDDDKLMFVNGRRMLFDLASDPVEEEGTPLRSHAARPLLEERVEALAASRERARARKSDPEMMQLLDEIGYVSP